MPDRDIKPDNVQPGELDDGEPIVIEDLDASVVEVTKILRVVCSECGAERCKSMARSGPGYAAQLERWLEDAPSYDCGLCGGAPGVAQVVRGHVTKQGPGAPSVTTVVEVLDVEAERASASREDDEGLQLTD